MIRFAVGNSALSSYHGIAAALRVGHWLYQLSSEVHDVFSFELLPPFFHSTTLSLVDASPPYLPASQWPNSL